jgi:hypothetical protein
MIFIVRTTDHQPAAPGVRVVCTRMSPAAAGKRDLFCVADEDAAERVRAEGGQIVLLHDGWYADDHGGGVAVWGNGRYWEVRDSPFDVIERG